MHTRPSQPFTVHPARPEDRPAIMALAKSLTEFFPDDVVDLIEASLDKHFVLTGELDHEIVGFLVYSVRDSNTAEIIWMGVKEEFHGLGLGSFMLAELEQQLEADGIKKLVASTLSYTVPYKPYEKVRTFYYHRGFQSLGIQSNYYEDGLDRLILVKNLY